MNIFLKEVKKFSKQNWWIYIIFLVCIFFIYKTGSGNIYEVILVFMFHFLGDIFVMMMGDFYAKKEDKKALYSQIGSFVVFGLIGIYAGIFQGKWSYLVPQILFFWPIIKGFNLNLKWISNKFMIIIGILVFSIYYYLELIINIGVFIQILGFIIFPISLIFTGEKIRYFGNLIAIFFIFIGSAYLLYLGFIEKNIAGTDLSYSLLPFTVFVFYLKNLKKYL